MATDRARSLVQRGLHATGIYRPHGGRSPLQLRQPDSSRWRRYEATSTPLFMVADQLGFRNDMSFHGLFEGLSVRLLQVGQHDVKRVELVKIAVPTDGGTGASVAGAPQSLSPSSVPVGNDCAASGSPVVSAGRLYTSQ